MNLLTTSSYKTRKGESAGYMTGILYLMPAESGGGVNLCPASTPECRALCLVTSGRGVMSHVQRGRKRKTDWWHRDQAGFMAQLTRDIEALIRAAGRRGLIPAVRLNGTSDIDWSRVPVGRHANIFDAFSSVKFYDYTKRIDILTRPRPANYDLTFSRSEKNGRATTRMLAAGTRTAVVFAVGRHDPLPQTWLGRPVADGDKDDLRFLDRAGVVIGLRAKGAARRAPVGGFVMSAGAA